MRGTITKIDPVKRSQNGNGYIRLHFKTQIGQWSKTDVCPDYRNYNIWKPFMIVGTELDNLKMKDRITIDADSKPILVPKQQTLNQDKLI